MTLCSGLCPLWTLSGGRPEGHPLWSRRRLSSPQIRQPCSHGLVVLDPARRADPTSRLRPVPEER